MKQLLPVIDEYLSTTSEDSILLDNHYSKKKILTIEQYTLYTEVLTYYRVCAKNGYLKGYLRFSELI